MNKANITFKQIKGFDIIRACQKTLDKSIKATAVREAIRMNLFKGNYINVGLGENADTCSPLPGSVENSGILSYTADGVDIPFIANSLVCVVHLYSGYGFKPTTRFYEMVAQSASDAASPDGLMGREDASRNLPTLTVSESAVYKGYPFSAFGEKYGHYVSPDGHVYTLLGKIIHQGVTNKVRAVLIGDAVKTDYLGRYVMTAYMLIWRGPAKDNYGNFFEPDHIIDDSIIRASQERGMFSKSGPVRHEKKAGNR